MLNSNAMADALATTRTVAAHREMTREERYFRFVNEQQDSAVRIAWRLLGGDYAAAEDVAQEAFLRAYQHLDRLRTDDAMRAWFFGILLNEARRYRRWRSVRTRWTTFWEGDAQDPRPDAQGDPGLRRRIAAALDRLSQPQREAFVLVHLEGFTVNEAGIHMGKAEGTVKSHLHRAMQALRADLGDIVAGRDEDRRQRP